MKNKKKVQEEKKNDVRKRAEKLDPNNKDSSHNPLIKKQGGGVERDDGFEHRTSKETTDPV